MSTPAGRGSDGHCRAMVNGWYQSVGQGCITALPLLSPSGKTAASRASDCASLIEPTPRIFWLPVCVA